MQLGQILLRKKWISSDQLEEAVRLQSYQYSQLGDLLVQKGLIAKDQLDTALREQYWRHNGFWVID